MGWRDQRDRVDGWNLRHTWKVRILMGHAIIVGNYREDKLIWVVSISDKAHSKPMKMDQKNKRKSYQKKIVIKKVKGKKIKSNYWKMFFP